jgi:hypothetical protein
MDNHYLKYSPTYEVTFCIGSREGYNGPAFTREDVRKQINKFQHNFPNSMPVKLSDTVTFTMKDYSEDGWEISAITYPNSPASCSDVDKFMDELAENMLYHFKQNRITIRKLHPSYEDSVTIMLEMKDAEKTYHK